MSQKRVAKTKSIKKSGKKKTTQTVSIKKLSPSERYVLIVKDLKAFNESTDDNEKSNQYFHDTRRAFWRSLTLSEKKRFLKTRPVWDKYKFAIYDDPQASEVLLTQSEYDGFKLETEDVVYDEFIQNPRRAEVVKDKKITLVEMTPKEYLDRCVRNNPSWYRNLVTNDKIDRYITDMKKGDKFPLPYINLVSHGQEGRHRAHAFNRAFLNQKMPVLIIDEYHVNKEEPLYM